MLGTRVGWWSFDTRRVDDLVRAAGGAASWAATAVLERVFAAGGSGSLGVSSSAALWRLRRFFRFLFADVAIAFLSSALCWGGAACTLGSGCCGASFIVIDRVILLSLFSLFTLGTGWITLGDGCTGDVVGVEVGALFSTNLSNSRSSRLPSLLVIPFHALMHSAIAVIILSALVMVGLVIRL